jgi:hypothetical protein
LIKTIEIPNVSDCPPYKNVLTPPGNCDKGSMIYRMGMKVFLNGTLRASFAHREGIPREWSFCQIGGFRKCENRTSGS